VNADLQALADEACRYERRPLRRSIRAAPEAGVMMLVRPSSQRTRYRGGCACSTSSITPQRAD
jgi:hypothetical protein